MFSRSDKTEDAVEAFGEPAAERSPMVLAALAGLLAIAGAFLLVFYLRGGDETAQPAADGTQSSSAQGSDGTTSTTEADRSVLVVTATIPRGTSVRELIEAPTVYLSARAVPEQFVAASAITSVAELAKFDGQVLASDALPGEQLLEGRFINPSSFDNPSLLDSVTVVDAPKGHHLVVIPLPAARALGGNVGAGDVVTIIAGFRVVLPEYNIDGAVVDRNGDVTFEVDQNGTKREVSTVVLNAVEVINVENTLEVVGTVAQDASQAGIANRGTYNITVAVEPDELTDLTYALQFGEDLMLAVAVEGADNDDTPRAATIINGILGDDGVWIAEVEDGNLIDFLGGQDVDGSSVEIEAPDDGDEEDDQETEGNEEADLEPGDS